MGSCIDYVGLTWLYVRLFPRAIDERSLYWTSPTSKQCSTIGVYSRGFLSNGGVVCQSNMTALLSEAGLFEPGYECQIPQMREANWTAFYIGIYRLTQDRLVEGSLLL